MGESEASARAVTNKMTSKNAAARWLDSHDNYLILTHMRPDGDTLGCAGAMVRGLRLIGKTAYVLRNPEITPRYAACVENFFAPDDFVPKHVIAVDIATPDLFPKNAAKYAENISLCIDHHGSNTMYARHVCCHVDYASCGEIVHDILEQLFSKAGVQMTVEIADCLYIAVTTDTGCFSYENTTANSHNIAAKLIDTGATYRNLNKKLFRTKRRERVVIDGMISSGIEYFFEGKVAIVIISREMMEKSGASEDDVDDIAAFAASIEGVCIGITIREMSSPVDCKISVRTSPPYNASDLCRIFGGGGHKEAAGATMQKSSAGIKKDLLIILEDYDFS